MRHPTQPTQDREDHPGARLRTAARGALLGTIAAALAVVLSAAPVLNWQSLVAWARDELALTGPWPLLVPVALDSAALLCVALSTWAAWRGESAGSARALVWLFAGGSSWASWRHGTAVGTTDAEVFFLALPLLAAVLLDVVLRRARRVVMGDLGLLEAPLPRYRIARWCVAPKETAHAWVYAVREGVSDPREALARSQGLPWPLTAAPALSDGFFEQPDDDGDQADTEDLDDVVDVVDEEPETPEALKEREAQDPPVDPVRAAAAAYVRSTPRPTRRGLIAAVRAAGRGIGTGPASELLHELTADPPRGSAAA